MAELARLARAGGRSADADALGGRTGGRSAAGGRAVERRPAGGRSSGRAEPGRAFELEADEGSVEDAFAERTDIDRTRAFVKIQDGCSFHCTYCIIPRARGPERSIAADERCRRGAARDGGRPSGGRADRHQRRHVRRRARGRGRGGGPVAGGPGAPHPGRDGGGAGPAQQHRAAARHRRAARRLDRLRRALPAPLPHPAAVGRRHDPAADGAPLRRRVLPRRWWRGCGGRSPEWPSTRT